MADRKAAQLVEIRLVELKRVDASFFQDYAKVHERLERRLDKEPRPLSPQTVSDVADELVVWLSSLAAKNYPHDKLSQLLRVGLGHLCAELIVVNPHLPQDEVAIRAYSGSFSAADGTWPPTIRKLLRRPRSARKRSRPLGPRLAPNPRNLRRSRKRLAQIRR